MTPEEILKLVKEEGNSFSGIHKGIPYKLRRNHEGAWCGYIFVDDDLDIDTDEIYVHGGVTFDECNDGIRKIGFDCAHVGDVVPNNLNNGMDLILRDIYGSCEYRTMEYVIGECKDMIDQVIEMCNLSKENNKLNSDLLY